jgi:hypothetical protein
MNKLRSPKVYLHTYARAKTIVVAACDENILGKKFKEQKFILDVSEKFYGGDLVDVSYAISQIRKATMANLVGTNIVTAAIEAQLIHPDAIHKVQGVPHAQRMTV